MPHGLQIWPPKLNLLAFNRSNPLDWPFQADQSFSFYNITPPRRLFMIAFHLTGDALSWYKYLFNNRLLTTWEAFTHALETRFGPSTYDNHQATLFNLQQTSTVTAYQTKFKRLSNFVVGLPPEALLNCFILGLRQDIQEIHPETQMQPTQVFLLQTGHDPPLDLRVQSYNNVSLEDKAHLHAGSIDTWATSTSGKSSFLKFF
ncbi:retrotransposon gag protein [Tanacetum coccineum]